MPDALYDSVLYWLHAASLICLAATVFTALTPSTHDDAVVNTILKIINMLAGNVLRNRNADEELPK